MDRHLLYGFSMVLAIGGCSEAVLQPSGGSCVRAAQCMPGLVCVLGQCTTDLSGLEGGVVPSLDAGDLDAGEVMDGGDAGPVGVDSGPMVMRDAGPGMDAGPMVMRDAGPGMDAGPPMRDAGTDAGPPPMMDAGTDAGPPPMMDAGTDAGPPPPVDAG